MLTGQRHRRQRRRGFTLIELLVTITLIALLAMLAAPSFTVMVTNARIRQAGNSLQNALRLAQATAAQRNRQVVLVMTNAAPGLSAAPVANGRNWYIRALPLQPDSKLADASEHFVQGGSVATAGITIQADAQTCFNSIGRVVANSATYTGSSAANDFTANCSVTAATKLFRLGSTQASVRNIDVRLSFGGQIRICTPDAAASLLQEGCV